MKKKNIIIISIGFILIIISMIMLFGNSNKKVEINQIETKIKELEEEINNINITDKIETIKTYETKISELSLSINELDSLIYEMYKNKEISLYDYMKYKNETKKYNNQLNEVEDLLEKKLTSSK